LVTTPNCSRFKSLVRTTSIQMSFPETDCAEMWRSWADVVTHSLRLWGQLDALPNSLKQRWRWLMVDKLTFNSLTTVLVDIPAVSMPIARSLQIWDICGTVLCDKTAHFRMAFYCPHHKVHLCNDHAV
jgi:hypothetical protein